MVNKLQEINKPPEYAEIAEFKAIADSVLNTLDGDMSKLKKIVESIKNKSVTPDDEKMVRDMGEKFGSALKKLEDLKNRKEVN